MSRNPKLIKIKRSGAPPWWFAPEWAKYLAMNKSGLWVWYESKPTRKRSAWDRRGGKEQSTTFYAPKAISAFWHKSMQKVLNYGAKTGTKEVLKRHWAYIRGEIDINGNKTRT